MLKRYFSILVAMVFAFCSLLCGCESKKCYFCKNEIQDEEHVLNSLQFPVEKVLGHKLSLEEDNRDGSEVVCENCQLKYLGIINGHCMRCLTEFGENDDIYYGYETEDEYNYDFGVCAQCAAELWGNERDSHLPGEPCSVCGRPLDGCEYQNTGVCEACAETVYN